jgi:hypothetical protein
MLAKALVCGFLCRYPNAQEQIIGVTKVFNLHHSHLKFDNSVIRPFLWTDNTYSLDGLALPNPSEWPTLINNVFEKFITFEQACGVNL